MKKIISTLKIANLIVAIELILMCLFLSIRLIPKIDLEKDDKSIIALYEIIFLILITTVIGISLIGAYINMRKLKNYTSFQTISIILLIIYLSCFDFFWISFISEFSIRANSILTVFNLSCLFLIILSIIGNLKIKNTRFVK